MKLLLFHSISLRRILFLINKRDWYSCAEGNLSCYECLQLNFKVGEQGDSWENAAWASPTVIPRFFFDVESEQAKGCVNQ